MPSFMEIFFSLGIEVARSKWGIFTSQQKYILDLLKETHMLGSKLVGIPIKVNHSFDPNTPWNPIDKER